MKLDANGRFPESVFPDVRASLGSSGTWTLSGTSASIEIPDAAEYLILEPSANIRIAIEATPVAAGADAFAVGIRVKTGVVTTLKLEPGTSRTLNILGADTNTVYVEWR